MTPSKDDIKKWLKSSNKSREWLAEQCGVKSKRSVDNWLADAGTIPPAKLLLIQKLMAETQASPYEIEGKDNMGKLFITLNEESQEAVLAECKRLNITLSAYCSLVVEWCATNPDGHAVIESLINDTPLPSVVMDLTPLVQSPATPHPEQSLSRDYTAQIIGNIAAGNLEAGDTVPQDIRINRPLKKGEYILRVNGTSMEPVIHDGAVIIMKKHTIPPIPKIGTIVEYNDERGVTLKKLARRKNPETGELDYVLHPLNPAFGDIAPMDGGRVSAVYIETLEAYKKS